MFILWLEHVFGPLTVRRKLPCIKVLSCAPTAFKSHASSRARGPRNRQALWVNIGNRELRVLAPNTSLLAVMLQESRFQTKFWHVYKNVLAIRHRKNEHKLTEVLLSAPRVPTEWKKQ